MACVPVIMLWEPSASPAVPRSLSITWPAGRPHSDLGAAVAVPGHFFHAESLVENLGAAVDDEHVKDQVLAFLLGLVNECADQAGADSMALETGVNLDPGQVDLAGAVFDVKHADVLPADGDDLPAVRVEGPCLEVPLDLLVPPPDHGDVLARAAWAADSRTRCQSGWPPAARCRSLASGSRAPQIQGDR